MHNPLVPHVAGLRYLPQSRGFAQLAIPLSLGECLLSDFISSLVPLGACEHSLQPAWLLRLELRPLRWLDWAGERSKVQWRNGHGALQ